MTNFEQAPTRGFRRTPTHWSVKANLNALSGVISEEFNKSKPNKEIHNVASAHYNLRYTQEDGYLVTFLILERAIQISDYRKPIDMCTSELAENIKASGMYF